MQDQPTQDGHPSAATLGAYPVMHTLRALERLALRPLSAPELAAGLGVGERTARRLLERLAFEGYAVRVDGYRRRYRLTLRVAALARQAMLRSSPPPGASTCVSALAQNCGATAHLWVPCYRHVACMLHADACSPIPEPVLRELAPAHASAGGKVLLAHRQPWRDSVLTTALERCTDHTLTDRRDLTQELHRVNQRGYAVECDEHRQGCGGVAAPVAANGAIVAALGLSFDSSRPTQSLIAPLVTAAADLTGILADSHVHVW